MNGRNRPAGDDAAAQVPGGVPVVGVGASAGGLDAFRKFLEAVPPDSGMAFILVQHLDPTYESMMVDLLAGYTPLQVAHARDGILPEPDHVYVIPPGTYLALRDGRLQLSAPREHHGARMPFDFLLHSMAEELGRRAVCVVLSGTGSDGSLGLKAIKAGGGLAIVQDPKEAGYDGMPQSAIGTGVADLVLPVAMIPEALIREHPRLRAPATGETKQNTAPGSSASPGTLSQVQLPEIIDLLRTETVHDFRLYKPGTLQRRIERRMAATGIRTDDTDAYLDRLRSDPQELQRLAEDLLINVTSFFRDAKVFDYLAEKIIPDLVGNHTGDRAIRIWIAGCSTGEEAYSLAMLFSEQIAAAKRNLKLQIFASDVDPDAIASAREGQWPDTIEKDVSPERLAHFFIKEGASYTVTPSLRSAVVFAVQDVLTDPPFSRLDMISCRNLLIYFGPEAQAKALSLFHFALRDGGILLLGTSETASSSEGRFEAISKPERIYRRVGRSRPGDGRFAVSIGDSMRTPSPAGQAPPSRDAILAEHCRRLVLETSVPAAVLVDHRQECVYSLGPIDRFLRIPQGAPSRDLFAMAPKGLRTKLRSAVQRARQENARVVVSGARVDHEGHELTFDIDAQPTRCAGEDLLLICFTSERPDRQKRGRAPPGDQTRVSELEQELETTRTELQAAIHSLELSSEEQKAKAEEALSVNEEFQSTNEELLTSKEELQSLNEELTALNVQLQETLEHQRATSNDLKNVLFSTDVATLFLDMSLNIRFYTPATRSLFGVIPTDIGRPLADLNLLATDNTLLADAGTVLQGLEPVEREIRARNGTWYSRRVLPYRTLENATEGVVITFTDVTERKRISLALELAKWEAELANLAKSRFLAAASHDLRQPLQTMSLLLGLLERSAKGKFQQDLVERLNNVAMSMADMLDTLLDINQIEAGTINADLGTVQVGELLNRLRDEYTDHAHALGLSLHVVPCALAVQSDPRLLEQMIRNLLANALKYTEKGKVLLGCRRRAGMLSIEVWDTGTGIPAEELDANFDEYYQRANPRPDTPGGLGLGLAIVQRLGRLLGHRIHVRSVPGNGSAFSIEAMLAPKEAKPPRPRQQPDSEPEAAGPEAADNRRSGVILVIEDDPDVRDALELILKDKGHHVVAVGSGGQALELVSRGTVRPDIILVDYNLPDGLNGLQVMAQLRTQLRRDVPVIILTGDISTTTLRDISRHECARISKPVTSKVLARAIQRLLPVT